MQNLMAISQTVAQIRQSIFQFSKWQVAIILHAKLVKFLIHTQTQPFYGSVDFVRDNPGEPVPEGTFHHLLDFLEQNEDNTCSCTNNLDGLPPHPD